MAKLPGLPSWSMYAGGTGAAPGKHSYDIRQDGKQYMISPFTTEYGRHAGYILNVFPGTNHGYQGITPDGGEAQPNSKVYRSPQAAVSASKKYHDKHVGQATNPSGTRYRGVITAIPGHLLRGGTKKGVSSWFSTKSDAAKWLRAMEQPGIETHFIERGKGRIDIGPRGSWVRKNPGGPLDTHAAKELELFVENDADLYRQQYTPINKNLITKMARGVYDHGKAVKLFGYLMESGAKKYARQYSVGNDWHQIFSPATRKSVAELFARHFEVEAKLGNYDNFLPKKYSDWRLKKNPNRLVDVLVRRNGKTFKAKAKYDAAQRRVRIFVNPRVAQKINPGSGLKIVPMTKERFEREVKPRLRAPYNLLPFALYKRGPGKGMHMLYRGSEFIKGGSKSFLKRYARGEAGLTGNPKSDYKLYDAAGGFIGHTKTMKSVRQHAKMFHKKAKGKSVKIYRDDGKYMGHIG